MRKILFAIAIIMTLGFTANAQGNDSFVDWESDWGNRASGGFTPGLPAGTIGALTGNYDSDPQAPLGSGLLVLTALGAGYAVAKKRKK